LFKKKSVDSAAFQQALMELDEVEVDDVVAVESTFGTTVGTKRAPSDSEICGESTQNDYRRVRLSSESAGSTSPPPLGAFDAGVPADNESSTSGGSKRPASSADLNEGGGRKMMVAVATFTIVKRRTGLASLKTHTSDTLTQVHNKSHSARRRSTTSVPSS